MTVATERGAVGHRPLTVCECDMDYCTKWHPAAVTIGGDYVADTIAAIDKNLCPWSESDGDWAASPWTTSNVTLSAYGGTLPDGVHDAGIITLTAALGSVETDIDDLTDNLQYVVSAFIKGGDLSVDAELYFYDNTAPAYRGHVQFLRAGTVWSKGVELVGTGDITSLGDGWYRIEVFVPAATVVAANNNTAGLIVWGAATEYVMFTGIMVHQGTATTEYQLTEERDGTSTNITLTTGGLTDYDHYQDGGALCESENKYLIENNGLGYVRVAGDASGEGLTDDIELITDELCGADEDDEPCYNTWITCQYEDDYEKTTKTYRWCEPRLTSKEQVSIDARPQIISAHERPPSKPVHEGIGTRASATVEFQDEAHHDRGVDPYVSERTYTPEDQGTWWGKFRARNPYYNGRPFRILRGWAESDGIDLANDFIIKNYILEGITGPDRRGRVAVTMKDPLKLADDDRALCPSRSTGVLDANITDVAAAATLSPAGIGNSEYPASGTLRIGAECMTFTRIADALTLTDRGTNGTTAATHSADDAVQLCYVVTDQTVDDVIYELLVTYAGISSGYITAADWATEVDDWMSGHTLTGIVTEPTGVAKLINEICSVYLVAVWWDEVNQKIRLKVTAPSATTWDTLTDDEYILRDSFSWEDDPSKRVSAPLVHWDQISANEGLQDSRNYSVTTAQADTDASGVNEYGSAAYDERFSRWYTSSADATRLVTILLYRFRDNPKTYSWEMTIEHDYSVGDIVELDTRYLQGKTGANLKTLVLIRQIEDAIAGHTRKYTAEAYSFYGRIGRWMGAAAPDYDAATDAEKVTGGWWADDNEVIGDDEPYRYA